jgi:hypothetical protein
MPVFSLKIPRIQILLKRLWWTWKRKDTHSNRTKLSRAAKFSFAKEYILNLASNDQDKDDDDDDDDNSALRNLLLNRIGALDHLQQAIHYPFLWKASEKEEGPMEVEWTPKVK